MRSVDIEGNNLTNGNDESGVLALAESLKQNDSLLCLNLNSCNLSKNAGKALKEALLENKKLINLDIERNPLLDHEDVRDIQKILNENCIEYRAERKREWQERNMLKGEENNLKEIITARNTEMNTIEKIRTDAESKQLQREQIFLDNVSYLIFWFKFFR